MSFLQVSHPNSIIDASIQLTASKSECNRALIIQALSGNAITLENISDARDSQTMLRLLASNSYELDVLDAGTTMRFLTAFCSATNRPTLLTGTPRMQQRPIGLLTDALTTLGADISFKKNTGYPPLKIHSFKQKKRAVTIRGDISSQFISALLMIGPVLPMGLTLRLTGQIGSRPYIDMTLGLMQKFGITITEKENIFDIDNQKYQSGYYDIEPDWSGASYWYSIVALSKNAKITLPGLRKDSFQGDQAIVSIMDQLGVSSIFTEKGVSLEKKVSVDKFEYDFTKCPDLAQTVAVICAAKKIPAKLSGLKSLRIKETDRIDAIKNELAKISIDTQIEGDESISLLGTAPELNSPQFSSYEDHRMAMAFAPLALLGKIEIEEKEVVNKSYPDFWKDLQKSGFSLEEKNNPIQ